MKISRAGLNKVLSMEDLPLKRKLMLSFFTLILLTLGILTVIITTAYTRASIRSMIDLASKSMVAIRDSLLYRMDEVDYAGAQLAAGSDLKSALLTGQDENAFSQVLSLREITKAVMMTEDSEKIFRVRLYPMKAGNMANQRANVFPLSEIENEPWYGTLLSGTGSLWLNSRQVRYAGIQEDAQRVMLSCARLVRGAGLSDAPLAVLVLDVYPSFLQEVLKAHSVYRTGIAALMDGQGNDMLNPGVTYQRTVRGSAGLVSDGIAWHKGSVNTTSGYLASLPLGIQSLEVVACVPDALIWQETSGIWALSILLMLVIGVAGYFIARVIVASITGRIQALMGVILKVREGDLNPPEAKIAGRDEIAVLHSTFSQMLERIRSLIDETCRMEKELQRAEVNMLQAQIQPHFLYNTLELINWSAQYNQTGQVTSLIASLSRFYKISLSKGREFIPVSEEIEHADMYMNIQSMRFDQRIVYVKEIDPAILPYSTLKILLQPLMENAILHGILESTKKSGTLTLAGRLDGADILFTVADDGVGMDEAEVSRLLAAPSEPESGYGLRNVHMRIQGMFGAGYGLTIVSRKGEGTQVMVRIPCME